MAGKLDRLLAGARLNHIAMAVFDRDRAVANLSRLGLGPFRLFEYSNNALVYGKPASYTLKMAIGPLGPGLDLEIIETASGRNEVHERFLGAKGEGIEHVAYEVEDLESSIRAFREAGFEVILTKRDGKPGSVYMEAASVGGLIIELMRKGFKPDEPTKVPD